MPRLLIVIIGILTLIPCVGCVGISQVACRSSISSASIAGFAAPEARLPEQNSKRRQGEGNYFKDRANDFVDIFSLSLSFGLGVQANVRATQAIQAGGLFWGGSRFGFVGREGGGWSETVTEFGLPGFYIRSVSILPGGGTIKRVNTERGQSLWQFLGDTGIPYDTGYDRKFWQVGATAHAGLIGADFSINLKELLDFLLGWFTVDISRDDARNRLTDIDKEENGTKPQNNP